MKTVNLVNLMKRAWDIRRADDCSMSEALKTAWAEMKDARYSVHVDEKREAITRCVETLTVTTIHDLHKRDILRAILRADVVDGIAMMCGKWAGLAKWAVAHA